jgi:chromosome segregation ATPase
MPTLKMEDLTQEQSDQLQAFNDEIARLSVIQDTFLKSNNFEQEKNQKITALNSQLDSIIPDKQNHLDLLTADIENKQKETIIVNASLEKIKADQADLESIYASENKNRKDAIDALDVEYNSKKITFENDFNTKKADYDKQIGDLQNEIPPLERQKADLTNDVNTLVSTKEKLNLDIPSKQSTLDGLTADISIRQAILDNIDNNIKDANVKLDDIASRADRRTVDVNNLSAQKDLLIKEISDLEYKLPPLKKEIDNLEGEKFAIADKRAKVDQSYAELATLYKRAGVQFPYEQ